MLIFEYQSAGNCHFQPQMATFGTGSRAHTAVASSGRGLSVEPQNYRSHPAFDEVIRIQLRIGDLGRASGHAKRFGLTTRGRKGLSGDGLITYIVLNGRLPRRERTELSASEGAAK